MGHRRSAEATCVCPDCTYTVQHCATAEVPESGRALASVLGRGPGLCLSLRSPHGTRPLLAPPTIPATAPQCLGIWRMGHMPEAPCVVFPCGCVVWAARILEEDADNDPDVARLLEGTGGDPEAIREKAGVPIPSCLRAGKGRKSGGNRIWAQCDGMVGSSLRLWGQWGETGQLLAPLAAW